MHVDFTFGSIALDPLAELVGESRESYLHWKFRFQLIPRLIQYMKLMGGYDFPGS